MAPPLSLAGRTVVVTGAASGMGRALAQRLGRQGCPVAAFDWDEDGLQETVDAIDGPVLSRKLDVRDRQAQMAFAAEVDEWAPAPIGAVFNNAGVTVSQTVADASPEDDDWVLDVNFHGVIHGTRAYLPILQRQNAGSIVNTSSVFGLMGFPTQSAYCASKAAVKGFTEALRHELRDSNVGAICVHPGGVSTNIVRNARFHVDDRGNTDRSRPGDRLRQAHPHLVREGRGDHPARRREGPRPHPHRPGRRTSSPPSSASRRSATTTS